MQQQHTEHLHLLAGGVYFMITGLMSGESLACKNGWQKRAMKEIYYIRIQHNILKSVSIVIAP